MTEQFPTYEQLQQGWLQMQAERDLMKAAIGVDLARIAELEKVLKELTFAARTTGGVAGPDEFLMRACRHAEFALRSAEEDAAKKDLEEGLEVGAPQCFVKGCGRPIAAGHSKFCEEHRELHRFLNECPQCGDRTDIYPVGSYHKCEQSGATAGPCAMCGTTTSIHLPFCRTRRELSRRHR